VYPLSRHLRQEPFWNLVHRCYRLVVVSTWPNANVLMRNRFKVRYASGSGAGCRYPASITGYIYNRLDIHFEGEGYDLREAYYRTLRLTGRAVIFTSSRWRPGGYVDILRLNSRPIWVCFRSFFWQTWWARWSFFNTGAVADETKVRTRRTCQRKLLRSEPHRSKLVVDRISCQFSTLETVAIHRLIPLDSLA
jgi:hypothetical protein